MYVHLYCEKKAWNRRHKGKEQNTIHFTYRRIVSVHVALQQRRRHTLVQLQLTHIGIKCSIIGKSPLSNSHHCCWSASRCYNHTGFASLLDFFAGERSYPHSDADLWWRRSSSACMMMMSTAHRKVSFRSRPKRSQSLDPLFLLSELSKLVS